VGAPLRSPARLGASFGCTASVVDATTTTRLDAHLAANPSRTAHLDPRAPPASRSRTWRASGEDRCVRVALEYVPHKRVVQLLRGNARTYPATIRLYDLAGDDRGRPGPGAHGAAEPTGEVTLADLGRMIMINVRPTATDAENLLSAASCDLFGHVPPRADIKNLVPETALYESTVALYDTFRLPNIGRAKRSKLLHIKRPWLIPISDSYVRSYYSDAAAAAARDLRQRGHNYWEAVRRDLVDGEGELRRAADSLTRTEDERRLSRLTPLRLLDIVAWRLASGA
jgi:hypothetical protein